MAYLRASPEILITDIIDQNGKTLLHEGAFQDNYSIVKCLVWYAKSQELSPDQIATWIKKKDSGDGFCALHYASFKGNTDICDILIANGANIQAKNNFGINMIHVAAHGKGLDRR